MVHEYPSIPSDTGSFYIHPPLRRPSTIYNKNTLTIQTKHSMSYAQRCRSDGTQLQRRRRLVGSLDGAARLATATSLPYPLFFRSTFATIIITFHISPIRFSLVTFALELYFHHPPSLSIITLVIPTHSVDFSPRLSPFRLSFTRLAQTD